MRVTPPGNSGGYGQGGSPAERANRDAPRRQHHEQQQDQSRRDPKSQQDQVDLHAELTDEQKAAAQAAAFKLKSPASPTPQTPPPKGLDLSG